jgi:hypothetical protein
MADRLAVEGFGGLPGGEEGPRAGLDPECPRRAAGARRSSQHRDALTARHIRAAREAGAVADLPLAFSTRVGVHLFAGETRAAAALVAESDALAEATYGRIVPPYGALALAAFRGDEDEVARLARTGTEDFVARGEGMGLTLSQWVTAALYNGLGRYDDAFAAATEATADPHELWFSTFATVELIEAASRTGRGERAAEARVPDEARGPARQPQPVQALFRSALVAVERGQGLPDQRRPGRRPVGDQHRQPVEKQIGHSRRRRRQRRGARGGGDVPGVGCAGQATGEQGGGQRIGDRSLSRAARRALRVVSPL